MSLLLLTKHCILSLFLLVLLIVLPVIAFSKDLSGSRTEGFVRSTERFVGNNIEAFEVPTGYPTFIYYEDNEPVDSNVVRSSVIQSSSSDSVVQSSNSIGVVKSSSTSFTTPQQASGHHYVSSPDVVSKWYVVLESTPEPSVVPTAEPTVQPSTYSPSLSPSQPPSKEPSPTPSKEPSTSEPTESPSEAPSKPFVNESKCINLLLTDTFGDGWDTASMFLYPSDGTAASMITLPCGTTSSIAKFCFHPEINKDGDYVVIGIMGYNPQFSWEIHWEALNLDDNKVYVGGFDTSLTFVFNTNDASGESVSLLSSVGELSQETSCETCVDLVGRTSSPSISPRITPLKPKKGPAPKKKTPVVPDAAMVSSVGDKLSSLILGGYNDTWYSSDWFGSNFYVSDVYGTNLLYSGALCSGKVGCDLNLADGSYKWRVTGALNTYSMGVYWKFCGIEGTSMNELTFSVKGDYCQAVEILDLSSICYAEQISMFETEVSLVGSFRLHGIRAESINNDNAMDLLSGSISQEFIDSTPNAYMDHVAVKIMSVSNSVNELNEKSRSLEGYQSPSSDVKFSLRLIAEDFREDGKSMSGQTSLTLHCKSVLQKSMLSGLFVARIVKKSRIAGDDMEHLTFIKSAQLLDLQFVHRQSTSAARLSYFGDALIFVCIVSGCIFMLFVAAFLIRKGSQNYTYSSLLSLTDDSESSKRVQISP